MPSVRPEKVVRQRAIIILTPVPNHMETSTQQRLSFSFLLFSRFLPSFLNLYFAGAVLMFSFFSLTVYVLITADFEGKVRKQL